MPMEILKYTGRSKNKAVLVLFAKKNQHILQRPLAFYKKMVKTEH